jgi:hypothetical protein
MVEMNGFIGVFNDISLLVEVSILMYAMWCIYKDYYAQRESKG